MRGDAYRDGHAHESSQRPRGPLNTSHKGNLHFGPCTFYDLQPIDLPDPCWGVLDSNQGVASFYRVYVEAFAKT
jgi:hypothetical protein